MFKNITLEMSLKPFKRTDGEYIKSVCRNVFEMWRPLLKGRESLSVMLWTADGSEILDYNGSLDDEFEWCRYIGNANKPLIADGDPPETSLHDRKHLYTKEPPKMTYAILKSIVSAIKSEGKKAFPDAEITVGETFDIGPEFAVSDFKYVRHTEICTHRDYVGGFVDTSAVLSGDNRSYAAYPDGIPDKTPFGLFLGKQANVFLNDMGFDYIWLSNGMGFSVNPWSQDGKVYDGENFHPERLADVRNGVLEFWRLFREGCPDFPVRTRGTNNSVGIDYASDGVPLCDIYSSQKNITPPPNSPWAALNDNFGLELMGHMTRICNLPGDKFMFRYYIHDPWWFNSPWYDRYDSKPHDIYLPMAVSRIDGEGRTKSAEILSILSIDNSFGDMPDFCVNEPLAHILKAERLNSDEPAPFVWVYPMREYTSSDSGDKLAAMYFGDKFICDAINGGFPLNCVVSADSFAKHGKDLYRKSILITPSPTNAEIAEKLRGFASDGIKIITYSADNVPNIDGALHVNIADGAEGLLDAAEKYGICIRSEGGAKPPTMTVSRHNNALFFSVYNANTTTKTRLRFPLGAPILMSGETEMENGFSTYRFSRSEHRECRIFAEQKSGVVGAREVTCSCMKYRRRFKISGLDDATVCFFADSDRSQSADVAPSENRWDLLNPPDRRFVRVTDEHGTYFRAEHITGDFVFSINR